MQLSPVPTDLNAVIVNSAAPDVLVGGGFNSNCTALDIPESLLPNTEITWFSPGGAELTGNNGSLFLALELAGLQVADSGQYECRIVIMSGLLSGGKFTSNSTFSLKVQGILFITCI